MSAPRAIQHSRYSTVSDDDLTRFRAKAAEAIAEAESTITELERQLGHELPSATYHREQLVEIDAEISRRALPAAS